MHALGLSGPYPVHVQAGTAALTVGRPELLAVQEQPDGGKSRRHSEQRGPDGDDGRAQARRVDKVVLSIWRLARRHLAQIHGFWVHCCERRAGDRLR